MRFRNTRGGDLITLRDALSRGYPEGAGFWRPESGADLRSAIYSPVAGFTDLVTLAASELLSESLDPRHAAQIVQGAFSREPLSQALGEDILVLDLASGPTGSSADYGAAFSAGLLALDRDPQSELVLASAQVRDAAALASAFSASPSGLPLVLLCGEGEGEKARSAISEGGSPVLVFEVEGGRTAASALERNLAGKSLAGKKVVAAGAATPARLLGRSLLFIGLFSLARRGLSGDLIVAAPPSDPLGLVTGLWAWSWGLPVSAFLLPSPSTDGAPPTEPDEIAGGEFLERFDRDYPLGSLVLKVPLAEGLSPLESLPDGSRLDLASSLAAQAARSALLAGLAGHGTIVVPRFAEEGWTGPRASRSGPAASATAKAAAGLAPVTDRASLESAVRSGFEALR
jgi:hypothetical protein